MRSILSYQCVAVLLSVFVLSACAAPGNFPGTSAWVLDADGEAEWQSRVNYNSGKVVLVFEPANAQCGVRFNVHFFEDKENKITHEVDLFVQASECSGELNVSASHFDTPNTKISTYPDNPFSMAQAGRIEISWVHRKHLSISVNGEPFVDGPLGRNFRYMKLVGRVGSIRVLELSHE